MSIISSLHLNTKTDAIQMNGNVATFIVDWEEIFRRKQKGTCRVYARLRSDIQHRTVSTTNPQTFIVA